MKLCLAGGGAFGNKHLDALALIEGVEVVSLVGRRADEPEVRRRILPGKSELSLERYYAAFSDAVAVFGRGEVSTYLLAGLGDSKEALLNCSRRLIALGVYPFVVPFVPISGTPLENHPAPDTSFMVDVYQGVADLLRQGDLRSERMSAGCAKCGACSALSLFEQTY